MLKASVFFETSFRMNKLFFTLIAPFILWQTNVRAQSNDSLQELKPIEIVIFKRNGSFLENTTSVSNVHQELLKVNHPERLLESFNLIAGVKMEERSPTSYRLSVRGSTIRSPFGVRNVKIYFDNFLLTDVTGNAYLNLIEPKYIQSAAIFKGPQGGEYGSETGGIVALQAKKQNGLEISLGSGSYNMLHQHLHFGKQLKKHTLTVGQSFYSSDGYREQSKTKRFSFFGKDQWKYNLSNEINMLVMFTDLNYQTPGGLTLLQMQTNRKQARLATNTLPSATEQNTGIINKTLLAGINHHWRINEYWKQFSSVQISTTDLKNPFISNYEVRNEKNVQARFYFDYAKQFEHTKWNTRFGSELGTNKTDFKNYDNNKGVIGNPHKFDELQTSASYHYIVQHISLHNKWFLDAALSLQTQQLSWETTQPLTEKGTRNFKTQWLPQIGISYKLNATWSIRGKIAKGISAPTTEEVRSSNQEIQNNLNAEYGWNKEIGVRKQFRGHSLEITAFDYHLKDAIVRRQDENGNDYFINAGGTNQKGLEISIESKRFQINNFIINGINFLLTGHIYDFKYEAYQVGSTSFSNNQLPGISKFSVQGMINFRMFNKIDFSYSNYFNSNSFLNDANTVKETGYVIGNVNVGTDVIIKNSRLNLYLGINNVYNAKYSAGYDLNAFGNRFYNPAPNTNLFFGMKFQL